MKHELDLARTAKLAEAFDLEPSETAVEATREIYAKLSKIISAPDWARQAPYVVAINALKKQKNAVILAHNYMTPEIYGGVADVVGDSLQLAIEAQNTTADIIVQAGVHFMAETSKILNPQKTVLIPDSSAGCSLASSVTPADIATLRAQYPGAPVVTYVNTTAEIKAVSDICCTSANALEVVNSMEGDTVIMAPDAHLARNIAKQTDKRIVYWEGACIVHERFTAQELQEYRKFVPDVVIFAHPECPVEVVAEADFSGSTKAMVDYVRENKPSKVLLVTECSMSANISSEVPEVEFLGPCNLCPFMQQITLEKILWSLHTMNEEVIVDPAIATDARRAVQRMINLTA
jgi:quinolinate synthase